MSSSSDSLKGFLVVVLFTLCLVKLLKDWLKNRQRKVPPCWPWLPIIGSLPFMDTSDEMGQFFVTESKKRGSDVVAYRAGGRYTVVLNGWQVIQEALVKKSTHFADRPKFFVEDQYTNVKCRGLVFVPYNKDFLKRRQMSLKILKDLGYGRNAVEARIMVDLERMIIDIKALNGQTFDPHDMLFDCVIGTLAGFMLGTRVNVETDPLPQQLKALYDAALSAFSPTLDTFPILRFLPSYSKQIQDYSTAQRRLFALFDERIEQSLRNECESFVNSYVKAVGPLYDKEELKYLVRDFLFGLIDTVGLMRWILVYVANYPDVQRRIQTEIDEVLSDRLPSLEDMRKLPYVEAVILEVMRRETMFDLGFQRSTLCDTEVDGYFIPKNTVVMPNIYSVHMDPDFWTNPSEFRPERFLNQEGEIINKERVIPFSLGKRACPGELLARQELFFILTRILQLFGVRPQEGQSRVAVTSVVTLGRYPLPYSIRMIPRVGQ